MASGKGVDFPEGAPPGMASLMSAVNSFLAIKMSIHAELSLIESEGVPEWAGEPISRGMYFMMTVNAAGFLGFYFDFRLEALIRLSAPSPSAIGKFFENPMGIITGEISAADLGLEAGIEIEAEGALPFIPSKIEFWGKITLTSFEMKGYAMFEAGPFFIEVSLEIIVSTEQLYLAFGGVFELGPLGSMSVYGEMGTSPSPFYKLNGSFCKPMFGFDMEVPRLRLRLMLRLRDYGAVLWGLCESNCLCGCTSPPHPTLHHTLPPHHTLHATLPPHPSSGAAVRLSLVPRGSSLQAGIVG